MADEIISPNSLSLNTFSAAAVVQFGLVTFSRNIVALFPLCSSIAADPIIVCIESVVASSCESPSFTHDLIIYSTNAKKYAGPEPLSAVTAS